MFKFLFRIVILLVLFDFVVKIGVPAYKLSQKTGNVIEALQTKGSQAVKEITDMVTTAKTGGNPRVQEAQINVALIEAELKKTSEIKTSEIYGRILLDSQISGPNKDLWKNIPIINSSNNGSVSFKEQVTITGAVIFDLKTATVQVTGNQILVTLEAPKILMNPLSISPLKSDGGTIQDPDKIRNQIGEVLANPDNNSYFYNLLFRSKNVNPATINPQAKQQVEESITSLIKAVSVGSNNANLPVVVTVKKSASGYFTQQANSGDGEWLFNTINTKAVTSSSLNSQIKESLFPNDPNAVVSTVPSVNGVLK